MKHLDVYGPYKSKRTSLMQHVWRAFRFFLVGLIGIFVVWIALLWMLDLYLSIGMPDYQQPTRAEFLSHV